MGRFHQAEKKIKRGPVRWNIQSNLRGVKVLLMCWEGPVRGAMVWKGKGSEDPAGLGSAYATEGGEGGHDKQRDRRHVRGSQVDTAKQFKVTIACLQDQSHHRPPGCSLRCAVFLLGAEHHAKYESR